MEKYYVRDDFNPTPLQLKSYVERYRNSSFYSKMNKLEKYYKGQNVSIQKYFNSNDNINNRIISGFPRFISTVATGYFLGSDNAIMYQFPDYEDDIRDVLNYNDETYVNKELGKNCSVLSCAIEQIYTESKTGRFRFTSIDPREVVLFFTNNVDEDIHSAVKFRYDSIFDERGNEKLILTLDYYDMNGMHTYIFDGNNMIGEDHNIINEFNDIPFIYYENPDGLGDFETVISLIDEYDKILSNSANMFDYFNDMYLIAEGFDLEQEMVDDLKNRRAISIPSETSLSFLAKPQVTKESLDFINLLDKDIHKFTNTPDVLSEEFFTSSGIAIKYKLQGLEYLTSVKTSNFKKGILRRFELLSNFLSLSNKLFDFTKIDIQFNRNTIESLADEIDTVLKLKGVVSDKTLLEKIPNINEEIEEERLNEEHNSKNVNNLTINNPIDKEKIQEINMNEEI